MTLTESQTLVIDIISSAVIIGSLLALLVAFFHKK